MNLAVKGYGLNQVLRQLEMGEPRKSGHQRFPWAVLSIVDDHVLRVAGRVQWLHDSPRYVVEPDGRLAARGTWVQAVGLRGIAARRLAAVRARDGRPSWSTRRSEQRLFVRILREIEAKLAADYGARLVVLYYSGETWHGDLTGWRDDDGALLCRSGVPVLDVNALLPRPPQAGRPLLHAGRRPSDRAAQSHDRFGSGRGFSAAVRSGRAVFGVLGDARLC